MTKLYSIDDSIGPTVQLAVAGLGLSVLEIKKIQISVDEVELHKNNGATYSNHKKKNVKPDLHTLLLNRLFYISHPSLSSLECSINLSNCSIGSEEAFNSLIQEILQLANFNHKQVEKVFKTFSIVFKDVAALKLLNILFKGHENHALFPLYLKWISGTEWMAQ